jgi:Terminase large subunit, T4likevirus-type, N-terminal/Terminase RNaseH-like domain
MATKLIPVIQHDDVEEFNSNPRLKKCGQKISMTKEQLEEYALCAKNPEYFVQNYAKIVSIDEGVIPFKLYDYEKKMISKFHRWNRVIMRCARQSGKTTTSASYILWFILFNSVKTAAILANKQDTATEILSKVQEMYMNVPLWMQQGIQVWNKTSFLLENGSRVISSSTSSNAIRGFSISLLFLDEYAHVPNQVAINFFTSVYPTISSGKTAKVIICSTPNGMNHFYKMFTDAVNKKNSFKHMTVKWNQVPGRNKKWAEDQKSVMSEEKFLQEQEVEFMGSAGTLISSTCLKNMVFVDPIRLMIEENEKKKFKMYEDVRKGHRYVMTVDVSHGKEMDYSAFSVIDVTKTPYKVVGVYHSNEIPYELYPNVIKQIASYYNKAYVLVESNDVGAVVLQILLDDLEYENVFYSDSNMYKQMEVSTRSVRQPGVRTTPKTKRLGCNALKALVENHQLVTLDFETIAELTTFVVRPNKTYAADSDCHDDLVMTLVLFGWLSLQPFFKDLALTDPKNALYAERINQIEQEIPLQPVIVDRDPGKNMIKADGVIWSVVSGGEDEDYMGSGGYF